MSDPCNGCPSQSRLDNIEKQMQDIPQRIDHRFEHYAPVTWVKERLDPLITRISEVVQTQQEMQKSQQQLQLDMQRTQSETSLNLKTMAEKISDVLDTIETVVKRQDDRDAQYHADQLRQSQEHGAAQIKALEERLVEQQKKIEARSPWFIIKRVGLYASSGAGVLAFFILAIKILIAIGPGIANILGALGHVTN